MVHMSSLVAPSVFFISLSLILYSNCSRALILLDLVLKFFDLMGFLSSILLHVSVDSYVMSVLLRYPRVFFAALQYTSLIWYHCPPLVGDLSLQCQKLELIYRTNAFSTSSCLILGMLYFIGLFFLAGAFLKQSFYLDITR